MKKKTPRKGRPEGRTVMAEIEKDVKRGYAAFCERYGLKVAGKWTGKKVKG